MGWRVNQAEFRARSLAKCDAEEAERYDAWIRTLTSEDHRACLDDLRGVFDFRAGMDVLDVGAGTGAMGHVLLGIPGISIAALEPVPAMLAKLKGKPEFVDVAAIEAFCDSEDDRNRVPAASFDVVISRQLLNGLFDPLAAFRNWHHWLKEGGSVIVLDGLYDRSSWTGKWEEEVDVLPMSACRTTALAPYLLECAGFRVDAVAPMRGTNARPSTRTPRYVVVASKRV